MILWYNSLKAALLSRWTRQADILLASSIVLFVVVFFFWSPPFIIIVVINAAGVLVGLSLLLFGVLAAYLRRWISATSSIMAATTIGYLIVAAMQTPPLRPEHTGPKLRVASFNVWVDNLEVGPTVSLIRQTDPDILLILEATDGWVHHLSDSLRASHPHILAYPLHHPFGIALFSKHPLAQDTLYLEYDEPPVLGAVVESPVGDVFFLGLHLAQPANPYRLLDNPTDQRNRLYTKMLEWILPYVGHMPILLAGDFNTVSWDPIYRRFLEQSYLNDARQGFTATYSSFWPVALLPIDHILYSDRLQVVHYERVTVPGSDHFGVLADFQLFMP